MRALSIAALLLLAACANGSDLGKDAGAPGVESPRPHRAVARRR
jgi:hypothetical protein